MRFIPLASTFLLVAATAQAGSNVKSLSKQFRRLDANRDELLTSGELAKLLPAKLTKNNALTQTQEEMFAWFDEDASEGIDLSEWLEAQTNTDSEGPDFSDEVIDELDTSGNGKLTWKEFSRVMNSYVPSKTARRWFDESSGGSGIFGSVSSIYTGGSFNESTGVLSVTVVGNLTTGSNSYTGSTTVSGGSLSVSGSLGAGTTLTGTGNLTLNSSGGSTAVPSGVNGSGTVTVASGSGLALGSGSSIADTASLFFGDAGAITLNDSTSLTGAGSLTLTSSGSGTLTLSSANTYIGGTTVSNGSLSLSGGGLSIVDFGGYDINAQTGTYSLFNFVSATPASSIDQSGSDVSE